MTDTRALRRERITPVTISAAPATRCRLVLYRVCGKSRPRNPVIISTRADEASEVRRGHEDEDDITLLTATGIHIQSHNATKGTRSTTRSPNNHVSGSGSTRGNKGIESRHYRSGSEWTPINGKAAPVIYGYEDVRCDSVARIVTSSGGNQAPTALLTTSVSVTSVA